MATGFSSSSPPSTATPCGGDDPEAFDPDHFLPERIRSRPAHVYKPFGTGERACIGRQFALHEAVLVLGTILRRYDIVGDPSYRLKVAERLTLMPEASRCSSAGADRSLDSHKVKVTIKI